MKRNHTLVAAAGLLVAALVAAQRARAAAPYGRYTPVGVALPGWVVDNATGLKWQQTYGGPFLNTGSPNPVTTYCGAPARLPHKRELESIVDFAATTPPAIDTATFSMPAPSGAYFATDQYIPPIVPTQFYAVDFQYGASYKATYSSTPVYVRCVQ